MTITAANGAAVTLAQAYVRHMLVQSNRTELANLLDENARIQLIFNGIQKNWMTKSQYLAHLDEWLFGPITSTKVLKMTTLCEDNSGACNEVHSRQVDQSTDKDYDVMDSQTFKFVRENDQLRIAEVVHSYQVQRLHETS